VAEAAIGAEATGAIVAAEGVIAAAAETAETVEEDIDIRGRPPT